MPAAGLGDTILVMGSGQRGLAAVFALRLAGVERIIVTGIERDLYKLELAKTLGATDTIVVDRQNVVERVMELTNGEGADAVLDVVPTVGGTVEEAISCVRIGVTDLHDSTARQDLLGHARTLRSESKS